MNVALGQITVIALVDHRATIPTELSGGAVVGALEGLGDPWSPARNYQPSAAAISAAASSP